MSFEQETLAFFPMETVPIGIQQCLNDESYTIVKMNNGFCDLLGYSREEIHTLFQDQYLNMILPADRSTVVNTVKEQLAHGGGIELVYRVMRRNDSALWVLEKGKLAQMADGSKVLFCALIDFSERKKEQEALRLSLERHQVIMNQTTDIIFEWDIQSDSLFFSSNWEKKFGYTPITRDVSGKLLRSSNIPKEDLNALCSLMKDAAEGVPYSETQFRIRNDIGRLIWNRVRATTQFDENHHPIKSVGVIIDIDEERKLHQELLDQAQKDSLTGLYNKKTLQFLVEEHLHTPVHDGMQVLMIIDVDNFKAVNDTYGHLCGDSLLSEMAVTLKGLFRVNDLIGRIGGDEFLVFLPDIGSLEVVDRKAKSVIAALQNIFPAKGCAPISCSIGIAAFPHGSIDFYGICRCADRALYHVKDAGKNGYAFYDPSVCDDSIPCGLARSAINEMIESETVDDIDEKLVSYTFRTLYGTPDSKNAIAHILEIIGRAYDISRVYIFENTKEDTDCRNTFEWCAQGIPERIKTLPPLSYQRELKGYQECFDGEGVFFCREISSLHRERYGVLASPEVLSLLQCATLDAGRFAGFVGFDECRKSRRWSKHQTQSLALIANILSTFLLNLRLREQLAKDKDGIT